MAKTYEVTPLIRFINWISAGCARLGIGGFTLVTTTGRVTGEARDVVVSPISDGDSEHLISPYGDSAWALNLRANQVATIRRGSTERRVRLTEVTGETPELVKSYYEREPVARRFMEVPGDATVDDFASVPERFPVFRIEED